MFYLVNLSTRDVECESNTRAGCVTSRRLRENSDAVRQECYAQRVIVTGLSRDEIDDLLQTDSFTLYAYEAGGGQ